MIDVVSANDRQLMQKQELWQDTNGSDFKGLDVEWIMLLLEAKKMGISPDEIRRFFFDR